MTMTFALSDPRLAAAVRIGQQVAFEFRGKGDGVYEIVSIASASASAGTRAAVHAHGTSASGAKP